MPKKKTNITKQQAASKAMWKATAIYIMLGALIFGVLWWARNNQTSDVAQQIRDLLGIELANAPEPAPVEPVVMPKPEPKPEPVIATEPPPLPEPEDIDWGTFMADRSLWPAQLKIEIDPVITLRYQGQSFGEMGFESGQILNVANFTKEGLAYGRTNGNEIEIHISATDFEEWFEEKHGSKYELTTPERIYQRESEDFEQELITNLRIWSFQNYNTPLIEIGKEHIVLRLHAEGRGETNPDMSLEAQSVARAYLRIQAELGGKDNYASCEIRDPDTNELLGSKGIFIPRL